MKRFFKNLDRAIDDVLGGDLSFKGFIVAGAVMVPALLIASFVLGGIIAALIKMGPWAWIALPIAWYALAVKIIADKWPKD